MANKRRYVRKAGAKGRFKNNELDNPAAKELFAKGFYKQNQKRIDSAINKYRAANNIDPTVSNEKIFTDSIKYSGRNFGSKKLAKEAIERKIYEFGGGDLDLYDAKHGGRDREAFGFKDLRKLNNRLDGQYHDYKYTGLDFDVEGYYRIIGSDIIIAKIIDRSSGSPYSVWQYMNGLDIGV